MTGRPIATDQIARRLTREELARAVRTDPATVDELVEWGFIRPGDDQLFRPSDIQRVRAVIAMRSPGIELDQLTAAFRERLFTLQPMDFLYPVPEEVTDTTPEDLARALGMPEADVIRLLTAAGFPAPVSGGPMRADDIRLARALVEGARALGGDQLVMRFARTYGDGARRAAESGVAMFAENVNSPVVNARFDDEARMEVNRLAAELMHTSEVLLGELYRRHLEHALLRQWANVAESFLNDLGVRPAEPRQHGLAFVDLSGYTAMTERSGDSTGARLAERLTEVSEEVASRYDGRVVKLLGDGAMLHFDEPLNAVRGALRLVGGMGTADLLQAHGGVHAGPVIERDGDYFGRTVNLAARVAALAQPDQVLVSSEVAALDAPDIDFQLAGPRHLKGIGEVQLFEASWR